MLIFNVVLGMLLGLNPAYGYSGLEQPQSSQEQARSSLVVNDTDGKPVARAFYTEGKFIVFYVYDLRETDKYAYHVWGAKFAGLETARNLGTLEVDASQDQEKRWKLEVTDAKLLADLDQIFVTAEPIGKKPNRPNGKKIVMAYLHPTR